MGFFLHTKKLFKRMFNPDGKNMNPHEEEIMDYLILNGGLEVAGIDSENQSFLYSFTPKIKELMPDLYEEHIKTVNSDILALWEKGYVNIDFMSDDPVITITKKSLNNEELSKLSKQDQWSIAELKRLMLKKEL
jgi:hypothetical protein